MSNPYDQRAIDEYANLLLVSEPTLQQAIERYADLQATLKLLRDEASGLADYIRQRMKDDGITESAGERYVARLKGDTPKAGLTREQLAQWLEDKTLTLPETVDLLPSTVAIKYTAYQMLKRRGLLVDDNHSLYTPAERIELTERKVIE